jgi:predicted TIM-barrel fold metal-dependent hydrolase
MMMHRSRTTQTGPDAARRQPGWINRRDVIAGLAAAAPFAGRSIAVTEQTPLRVLDIPEGACDTHVHVIGDPHQFPMAADRTYTPPPATATALGKMLQEHRLSRAVIVAAEVDNDTNDAIIDAIRQLGKIRTRGVAWLPKDRSGASFEALQASGITGFRVLLGPSGKTKDAVLRAKFQTYFDIAARWGWHLDIAAPPDMIAACLPSLGSSPVPLVLDTFGWIQGGLGQPGVDAILSLVWSGRAYVKLSEPYRLSNDAPGYPELKPVVDALIAANPDRILWGSGWPHLSGPVPGRPVAEITPNLPVDTGDLLNLFAAWVPDDGMRRKILVENPARLYGFGDA